MTEDAAARTIVITGASSGIGAAAARQLVLAGQRVVIVGRDRRRTQQVAGELGMPFHVADFAVLAEVRALAEELLAAHPCIDVLANNAGGIFGDRTVTVDGLEATFQTNHLAPFLLTNLLRERLVDSGASVIQTSSVAARRFARWDIDDLNAERRYSASAAYGNAKLANVLFTKELARRWGGDGVAAAAFHPGVIGSSFASTAKGAWRFLYTNPVTSRLLTSVDVGGARLAWLALGKPGLDWESGGYYEANRPARTSPLAADPVMAGRLWERSAEMVGL